MHESRITQNPHADLLPSTPQPKLKERSKSIHNANTNQMFSEQLSALISQPQRVQDCDARPIVLVAQTPLCIGDHGSWPVASSRQTFRVMITRHSQP